MRPSPLFRTICLLLVLVAIFALRKACAGDSSLSFPYEAIVGSHGTTVHAAAVHTGNGENFYVTGRLEPGTPVSVFRHDPDGWHMIAPPEGAFSLIPAGSIEPLRDNLAEIVADDICTRIGSTIGEEFAVEQIPLRRGTRVELLPEQAAPDGWIAIRPPRGEYRWVKASDLEPPPSPAENMADAEESTDLVNSMRELDQRLAGLENENPAIWNLEALSLEYLRLKRSHVDMTQQIDARLERITELKLVRAEHLGQTESVQTSEPIQTPAGPTGSEKALAAAEQARQVNRPAPPGSEYYPTNISSLPVGEPMPGHDGPQRPDEMPVAKMPPAETRRTPPPTTAPEPSPSSAVSPQQATPYPTNVPPTPNPTPTAQPPGAMPTSGVAQPRRFDAVGYIQKAVNPPPNAPAYVLVSRDGRILAYLQQPANTSFESFLGYPMGVDGQPRQQPGMQLPLITVERLTPVRFPEETGREGSGL